MQMKLRRTLFILFAAVIASLGFSTGALAAKTTTTAAALYINNKKVTPSAYNVNGNILIPFREVFETMNCKTEWNTENDVLKASRGGVTIELTIGKANAKLGAETFKMKAAPRLINGKTYVSVELVTKAFGYKTAFDSKKKRVDITGKKGIGVPGGVIHSGYIKPGGETWTAENGPHIIQYTFEVGGDKAPVLVIQPGAMVLFDEGADMRVGWIGAGGLMVNGTKEEPVTFAANTDSVQPGYYDGIYFYENSIKGKTYIRNASIQSAGNTYDGAVNIKQYSKPNTVVELKNVLIKDSLQYGLKIEESSTLAAGSTNVSVTGTITPDGEGGYPIWTRVPGSNGLPTGGTFTKNAKNAVCIYGGVTENVEQNLTWNNLGIPYAVDTSLEVGGKNNPVFTVKPGVVALFADNEWIRVGYNGSGTLVADAAAEENNIDRKALEEALKLASQDALLDSSLPLLKKNKSIVFGFLGKASAKGKWYGIRFLDGAVEDNVIDGCVISGAGVQGAYGDEGAISAVSKEEAGLQVSNTLVSGSNTYGLDMYGKVEMTPESTGNIFMNNNFPIKASPHSVASLSMSNLILGNVNNFIQVADGKEIITMITESVTWNNLGVPFLIKEPLGVNGGMQEAVLTLAGGVNLLFDRGSGIEIGKDGPASLITLGTAANPVTFTSVLKQAGAWEGLHFFDQMGMSSKLEGIVLEYASNGITFEAAPGSDILKQSTIQFCKELGINKKFTDIIDYILDFMIPDLGNIFKGNGQDQN